MYDDSPERTGDVLKALAIRTVMLENYCSAITAILRRVAPEEEQDLLEALEKTLGERTSLVDGMFHAEDTEALEKTLQQELRARASADSDRYWVDMHKFWRNDNGYDS